MNPVSRLGRGIVSLFLLPFIFSCAGTRPDNLGISDTKLTACPTSPNCVSSDATDADHLIEPFHLIATPSDVWQETKNVIAEISRTRIITFESNYLHAECRSAVFGFVDDLELHLRPEEKIIAVRSAARLGYSDLGVNKKRIEALRSRLINLDLIASPNSSTGEK